MPLDSSEPLLSTPTRGLGEAKDFAGIDVAHDGELGEVHAARKLEIGACVQQHEIARARGHPRGDGGTFHPRKPAEFHGAAATSAPVLPGEMTASALPSRDQINGADHGGILLPSDALDGACPPWSALREAWTTSTRGR